MAMVPVLRELTERRLRALEEHLPSARGGDPVGVHQARVASRRLRELIPVAGADAPRERRRRARRAMRRLTRALGAVRELDVTLVLLDTLASNHPDLAAATEPLEADLRARRAVQGLELDATLASDLSGKAARRVEALLGHGHLDSGSAQALADRIASRAGDLRRVIEDVGLLFDDERLHLTRIAAKKLRYALEVAGEARLASTVALVRQLKGVQDVLGELHDRHVLLTAVGWWRSSGDNRSGDTRERHGAMERLASRLERERRALHAKYLRRRPRLIAVADAARDRIAVRVLERSAAAGRVPVRHGA
jgi:CHAD domain-containing protein